MLEFFSSGPLHRQSCASASHPFALSGAPKIDDLFQGESISTSASGISRLMRVWTAVIFSAFMLHKSCSAQVFSAPWLRKRFTVTPDQHLSQIAILSLAVALFAIFYPVNAGAQELISRSSFETRLLGIDIDDPPDGIADYQDRDNDGVVDQPLPVSIGRDKSFSVLPRETSEGPVSLDETTMEFLFADGGNRFTALPWCRDLGPRTAWFSSDNSMPLEVPIDVQNAFISTLVDFVGATNQRVEYSDDDQDGLIDQVVYATLGDRRTVSVDRSADFSLIGAPSWASIIASNAFALEPTSLSGPHRMGLANCGETVMEVIVEPRTPPEITSATVNGLNIDLTTDPAIVPTLRCGAQHAIELSSNRELDYRSFGFGVEGVEIDGNIIRFTLDCIRNNTYISIFGNDGVSETSLSIPINIRSLDGFSLDFEGDGQTSQPTMGIGWIDGDGDRWIDRDVWVTTNRISPLEISILSDEASNLVLSELNPLPDYASLDGDNLLIQPEVGQEWTGPFGAFLIACDADEPSYCGLIRVGYRIYQSQPVISALEWYYNGDPRYSYPDQNLLDFRRIDCQSPYINKTRVIASPYDPGYRFELIDKPANMGIDNDTGMIGFNPNCSQAGKLYAPGVRVIGSSGISRTLIVVFEVY